MSKYASVAFENINPSYSSSVAANVFSSFPYLSNNQNLTFFDSSNFYTSNQASGIVLREESIDSESVVSQASSDVKGSGIESIATELPEYSGIAEVGEAEDAVEAIEAGSSVAESSTPIGLALLVNQQLGQAVTNTQTSAAEQKITSDFVQNSQQHGLNVGLNASLIQSEQMNTLHNQEIGGNIGSLFGPLGALIGHAVAGVVDANPSNLFTGNSFQGVSNTTDSNVVASQTTASLSGNSVMENNVEQ